MNYSEYLRVRELTSLQHPVSSEQNNHELLFIHVHQVYELWFKQILAELDVSYHHLCARDVGAACQALQRVCTIFRVLVNQVASIKTLTLPDFNVFRPALGTASGYQSFQFVEIELALSGHGHEKIKNFDFDDFSHQNLIKRAQKPSLWQGFLHLVLNTDHEEIDADALIELIHERLLDNDTLTLLCDRLLDIDEYMQEWKYRHYNLVRRVIGQRSGTGGSSGEKYLFTTLTHQYFPLLWKAKTLD